MLDADDMAAIRALFQEEFAAAQTGEGGARDMSRAQAQRLAGTPSDAAFARWCQDWGVEPSSRGRYSRQLMQRGKERQMANHLTAAGKERRQAEKNRRSEDKARQVAPADFRQN